MIAAIYARKSTEQNVAEDAKSVTRQVEHATLYAQQKGWTVGEEPFVDDGISGAEFEKRPAFMRMIAGAKARAFHVLVMSDFDRLGREGIETMYWVKKILESGVRIFLYLDDREQTLDTALEIQTMQVKSMVAAGERDNARKRVYDSMVRKARVGHVTGGRTFGYDNVDITVGVDSSGRPVRSHVERRKNEREAAIVLRVFELYAKGAGLKQIARTFNNESAVCPRPQQGRPAGWSPSTIRAILRRPVYHGEPTYNQSRKRLPLGKKLQQPRPESEWIRCRRPELQIVPDSLWDAVQHRLQREQERYLRAADGRILSRPARHTKYLLTGLTQCSCGSGLEVIARFENHKQRHAYGCAANRRKGDRACSNSHLIWMNEADDAVLNTIEGILNPDRIERAVERALQQLTSSDTKTRRRQLEAESQELDKKIRNLTAAIERGAEVLSIAETLRQREARQKDVLRELKSLDLQRGALDHGKVQRELFRRAQDWRGLLRKRHEQGQQILRKLIAGRLVFEPMRDGTIVFRGTGTLKGLFFDGTVGSSNRGCTSMASPTGLSLMYSGAISFPIEGALARAA